MPVNPDCSSAPAPEHGVVEFDFAEFVEMFPGFAAGPEPLFEIYFELATQILNNTCRSVVCDGAKRLRLLYLLVAHIATIVPLNGGAGSGVVIMGPITGATEGSVSIQSGFAAAITSNNAWFMQTQFGALFWQLTAVFRTMHYIAPTQCCGPAGQFAGRRGY